MQVMLGELAVKSEARQAQGPAVCWDSKTAVNGHFAIFGMTGSGKTTTLRRIISAMRRTTENPQDFRVHVFDVHGDLDIGDCSTVLFSEQTNHGLNPLVINPDPHYGGVRKRIQAIIRTINSTSHQLGQKQEAVLRNILNDLYSSMGFDPSDPRTWSADYDGDPEPIPAEDGMLYLNIPYEEKEAAKEVANIAFNSSLSRWGIRPEEYRGAITRWQPYHEGRRYPSVKDALLYAERIYRTNYLGLSHDAVMHLEGFNRAMRSYKGKLASAIREQRRNPEAGKEKVDKIEDEIQRAKERAHKSFTSYIDSVQSGREMETVLKYDSLDVLKSVVDRLDNLSAIGVFKSKEPPFSYSKAVWRYHIKALSREEQKLFMLFKLDQIFMAAVQRGECDYIREVCIVDEAARIFDKDEDNPLNIIANEARKFGLALICASQSPTHYTDDFMGAVGCKIILGIDELHYDSAIRKLRVDERALRWIRLTKRMLVQIKEKGNAQSAWQPILVPEVRG